MVESYLQDEIVDQITLNFVVPDAISVLSWIREPGAEEFTAADGDHQCIGRFSSGIHSHPRV